jgi:hypothetical protein
MLVNYDRAIRKKQEPRGKSVTLIGGNVHDDLT